MDGLVLFLKNQGPSENVDIYWGQDLTPVSLCQTCQYADWRYSQAPLKHSWLQKKEPLISSLIRKQIDEYVLRQPERG